jgi:hypothetical protein
MGRELLRLTLSSVCGLDSVLRVVDCVYSIAMCAFLFTYALPRLVATITTKLPAASLRSTRHP